MMSHHRGKIGEHFQHIYMFEVGRSLLECCQPPVSVPTACKTKEAAVYYQSRCHDPQLFFAVEVCAGGGRLAVLDFGIFHEIFRM